MDTPDGPVFGCNLDLFIPGDGLVFANQRGMEKLGWQTSTTGERAEWTSEYGSVTFSLAGREFAWSGMNEAGLVISSMQLASGEYPERDERPGMSDGQAVQYMLDSCSSVAEALEVIKRVRVHEEESPPSHYLLADAGGDCAAIEYVDGDLLIHAGDDLPVRAMANMPYSRSAEAYERGGTRWWWSNPGQSAERVAAAENRCRSFDAASDTSAVNYAFGTLVYYVAAPHTRWNIVYDIAARKLFFRSDQSPTYKHISLDAFDFSCSPPLLMLDVNAQLEGDIEEHFAPYDPAVNREVFHTFTSRWGIWVSEENTTALMEHIHSYECAD
jgi:choloylglycine hydrolase